MHPFTSLVLIQDEFLKRLLTIFEIMFLLNVEIFYFFLFENRKSAHQAERKYKKQTYCLGDYHARPPSAAKTVLAIKKRFFESCSQRN
jgi:hypothetical protein